MQMNYLITSLQENEKFKEVVENVNEKISPIAISGLSDVSKVSIISSILESTKRKICVLTYNEIQAKKLVKDLNKINIGNKIMLYKEKDNYILKTDKEKYLLFVNYEKINFDYDIINFRKGDINEINIFNGKVIEKN